MPTKTAEKKKSDEICYYPGWTNIGGFHTHTQIEEKAEKKEQTSSLFHAAAGYVTCHLLQEATKIAFTGDMDWDTYVNVFLLGTCNFEITVNRW